MTTSELLARAFFIAFIASMAVLYVGVCAP